MPAYKNSVSVCTLRRQPDYSGVRFVTLLPDTVPADFSDAISLAEEAAALTIGENMLLSWYDRDRNFEVPQHVSECDLPGAVPGYVDYGLSHGASLKVDIDQGRFVFFFRSLAE